MSKFTNNISLGDVDSLEDKEFLKRDVDELIRGMGNHQLYEIKQGRVLDSAPGLRQPDCVHKLGKKRLQSSIVKGDLGVLVDGKLNLGQQCLGCIRYSIAMWAREGIVLLCSGLE